MYKQCRFETSIKNTKFLFPASSMTIYDNIKCNILLYFKTQTVQISIYYGELYIMLLNKKDQMAFSPVWQTLKLSVI